MSLFTKQRGFTLIGVMIAVAIIAILAAIAYPSYMKYVQQSRRQQAIAVLHSIQLAEEQYRANNSGYATLDDLYDRELLPAQITAGNDKYETENGYYTLSVSNSGASHYTITAKAKDGKSQANDTGCTVLTMNQDQPEYTSSGKRECWRR